MGKKTAPQVKVQPTSLPAKRGALRPFVSVICPTYNRRQFLPNLIHQFNYQTYPQEYMELIILDDSPESNADIIPAQANIKYTHLPEKLILGKKRNLLNSMTTGDIIVCFDDDDFYSQERVAHAVNKLQGSKCEIAGSSIIHIYYPKLNKIYQFGPYAPYHGTNGTMAYTKKYLKTHSYLDDKTQAEEAHFTNNFSEKMIQLDPHKVMLCIAHNKNTVEKDQFLNQGKETTIKIQKFFKTKDKYMLDYLHVLGEKLNAELPVKNQYKQDSIPDLVDELTLKRIEFVRQLKEKNIQVPDDILQQIQIDQMEQILNQINSQELVESSSELVESIPELVESIPELVESSPQLVDELSLKKKAFEKELKEKNIQISDEILKNIQIDQMDQILSQIANFMHSPPPTITENEEPLTNLINPPV
jgi:glycosyltransferase involved in cell wall biosynthesis